MTGTSATTGAPTYVLGHTAQELERLEVQSRYYHELTNDFFVRAGVAPGHRVLDVGCGAGDVSLLTAELVGPAGRVLGVDRAAAAVDTARARAAARSLAHAKFAELDVCTSDGIDALVDRGPFDAIVGRFVLMYMSDPVSTLQRLAGHVRPGGVLAFVEMDLRGDSWPRSPLWQDSIEKVHETYVRAGLEPLPALKMRSWFSAAGLTPSRAEFFGRIEGGSDPAVYTYFAGTMRSLLPMMERFGVTTAAELDVDTLADRLRAEAVATGAALRMPVLGGVAART
jgi:ubiquinone/menaquinone biosynthesis C-methylase UbiE